MTIRRTAVGRSHQAAAYAPVAPERRPTETLVREGVRDPLVAFSAGFLRKYGYLDAHDCPDDLLCPHTSRALHDFQVFYGLEPTGTLTLETLKLIKRPRCDVPDFSPEELGGEGIEDSDPFVFYGDTWPDSSLGWFLSTGTPDLPGGSEAFFVQAAFDTWAQTIPRTFSQQASPTGAQFDVSWQTGDHGDGQPFDGRGHVLAHAFSPQDGRVHFDDAESWFAVEAFGFIDLQSVALHEIGHALGLRHSGRTDAVMYAFHDGQRRELHEVDIKGMRSRYAIRADFSGRRSATVPLWALESTGGCDVVTVDFGRSFELLAWGQLTMLDSTARFDRDNYCAVEVFMVDGERPGPYVFGGDHFGSDGAPCNCYTGAWVGVAQTVTFRLSVGHMQDIEAFGTGNVIVLGEGGKP